MHMQFSFLFCFVGPYISKFLLTVFLQLKLAITVGIVGLPNVGKSSLINRLKRSRVVNVGSTPGVTRSMQEVHLDKKVKLLDCPGVVMLKSSDGGSVSVALRNCKRVEKMDDPIGPGKPHCYIFLVTSISSVEFFFLSL
jgi:ribosome biogenesis GTPase A